MARFGELGLKIVANSHTVLSGGDAALVLAGFTDIRGAACPGPTRLRPSPARRKGAKIVLLDHQPKLAASLAKAGVR